MAQAALRQVKMTDDTVITVPERREHLRPFGFSAPVSARKAIRNVEFDASSSISDCKLDAKVTVPSV